ncbi:Hypothetical protein Cp1002B_0527 [Corynebacterium pseudotuberculosis]|nr:Hypothetical protein CpPAT10_0504a [Corynebacterium pseudotuberculosis PAT10]AEP69761.1 Hypothetical protein Cp4202_0496 [Corynebacterium pseudotuberculosis 42/02-A]AER68585.1 Hypothetical protein Cp106_0492 [Corynebacterium pseudotuberculosis 1/06-A]AFH51429.1 Hypothetical protein Cp267_0524 [Corynebacterium pseudotuberculosis 267]AJC13236.1 hypothetical protein CpVD57_0513 [Corynebacterium pseudotuberculosis]
MAAPGRVFVMEVADRGAGHSGRNHKFRVLSGYSD